jgi:hypothetical protein
MRLYIIIFVLISLMSYKLSAQNATVENNDGLSRYTVDTDNDITNETPKLLIHTGKYFPSLSYQFPDGSPVSSVEFGQLLDIPSNQLLLKQIRQSSVVSRSLGWFTLAVAGSMFAYIFADLPNAEIMLPVLSGVGIVSAVGSVYTSQVMSIKILQAIDNYNLSILGIPINISTKK